ncbi:MAG TPA: PKD domain-containing protein [Bacteroidia bacterium]|jgi:PKD repeat protein|nr:PKD domain-containing protein [Bacteroidia bacterium]
MKKLVTVLSLAVCLQANAQIPTNVPTSGLVGYWPCTGNANDSSGNGNNGVVTNATLTADRFGNANAAYNYNGTANITASLSTPVTGDWSVSGWYYKTGGTNYNAEYFLSFGTTPNGNGLGFGGANNLCEPGYFSLYDGAGSGPCFTADNLSSSGCNVVYGQWQHMVMVKSGTNYSIYCNGVLQASNTMLSMPISEIVMGLRADNQFNFNGYIDDIGLWNRALDSTEIFGLYNNYTNNNGGNGGNGGGNPPATGVCTRTIFADNFSNPANWTAIGTGAVNVSGGTCNLNNVYDGVYNKVYQNIGTTLSNTYFKAQCKYTILSPNPSGNGVGAVIMGLTAGNQDFLTADSSAAYAETNQDAIGVIINSADPYDNVMSDWYFRIESKKGNVRTTAATAAMIYANPAITTYYIQLERLSTGVTRLSIFSDSAYTNHITGSPVTFSIDSTITGLNTVQHGTSTPGWYYRLNNATIDNDLICDDGNIVATCNAAFTYTIAAGGQVNFTNNGSGSYNSWSFGDGVSNNTLNPSHTYASNGVYTVQEAVTDSANNVLCLTTQTISITNAACNAPAPTASYTLVADSVPHWWDLYVNFGSSVVNATWYWGDGNSSTGLYPSYAYDSAGVYNICVTAYNACGDSVTFCQNDSIYRLNHNSTSSLITHVNVLSTNSTTGINQVKATTPQLNIYPNPSNGNFVVETNDATNKMLQIYDINGNLVLSQTVSGTTNVDASNLNNGIYNLNIIGSTGVINKRLVIVK